MEMDEDSGPKHLRCINQSKLEVTFYGVVQLEERNYLLIMIENLSAEYIPSTGLKDVT